MRVRLLALLLLGTLVAGCDDAFVDPFVRGEGAFTVYGFLLSDAVALEQKVRVIPVRTFPEPPANPDDPTAQLDVDVWSTHLGTGDSLHWTQRLVHYDDGTVGYVFARTFRAEPGATYRLTVRRRADGRTATAGVLVPPVPPATVGAAEIAGPDSVVQTVRWDAARLDSVAVYYRVPGPGDRPVSERLAYPPVPAGEGPRPVVVDFVRDAARIRAIQGLSPEDAIGLYEMTMRVRAPSAAWVPPLDDPEILAQPGTLSNVEGGYGFVGAATYGTVRWLPPREVAAAAGFVPRY